MGKWWLRSARRSQGLAEPVDAGADEAPQTAAEAANPLDEMTKADLVAMAEERGLDTTGTKADLVERLGATDAP